MTHKKNSHLITDIITGYQFASLSGRGVSLSLLHRSESFFLFNGRKRQEDEISTKGENEMKTIYSFWLNKEFNSKVILRILMIKQVRINKRYYVPLCRKNHHLIRHALPISGRKLYSSARRFSIKISQVHRPIDVTCTRK